MNMKSDPSEPWDSTPRAGIPNYVNLAAGLGKATRERAAAAVRGLLSQTGLEDAADHAGERMTKLTDEVLASSRANRELMIKLISGEVEKVADQLGFARKEDLDDLRREVNDLRVGLAHQSARTEEAAARTDPAEPSPAEKTPAKKAAAKKAPAKKSAAKKTAAKKSVARKSATASATE